MDTNNNFDEAVKAVNYSCRMCGYDDLTYNGTVELYDFFQCNRCQFVFCPSIDQKYMENLYNSGYHNSEDGAPAEGWADMDFILPVLDRIGKKKLKIMDFGCGESYIPDHLRAMGHHVTGLDVAPPVRKQEDRLTGNILDLNLPANSFDLVYSYQVFEHLPEPKPVLDKILEITKNKGYVLIHTDMEVKERFEAGFANWWYVAPPDHCVFFMNKTFEECLKNKPYQLIEGTEKTVLIRKDTVAPAESALSG